MQIVDFYQMSENDPPEREVLMLTGPSGMSGVNKGKFLVLGYCDNEYRPPIDGKLRWLDVHNDALSDRGYEPTHWAYPIRLP